MFKLNVCTTEQQGATPPIFLVGMFYVCFPVFESNNMQVGNDRVVSTAAVYIQKLVLFLILETKLGATRPSFAIGIA